MNKDIHRGDNLQRKKIEVKIINSFEIINTNIPKKSSRNILVAGCGEGYEAELIYNYCNENVDGIDLNAKEKLININDCTLNIKKGTLENIESDDGNYDIIYSYHVLEHVENPGIVLKEFKRVLNDDGVIFIGFPNRMRLMPSYFKSHINISIWDIVKFNVNDYARKITGRFKNEYGAHAGFSESEFIYIAENMFTKIISIRSKWVATNYNKYINIVKIINKLKLGDYIYPSNYFILKK